MARVYTLLLNKNAKLSMSNATYESMHKFNNKCLNGHFQALTRPNKMTNRITTYCKCYDLSRKLLAPKKLYYEQNSLILRRHSRLENCNIKLLLQEHHLRSSLKNDERSKILWKLIYIQDKIAYLNFTSQLVLPFQ
jgi:hypothetical protein